MKKILPSFVLLTISLLPARGLNWTNYPTVTTPAPADTLLIGTTTTNKQWAVSALLTLTGTNAASLVTAGTNGLASTNYANSIMTATSNGLLSVVSGAYLNLATLNQSNTVLGNTLSNNILAVEATRNVTTSNAIVAAITAVRPVTNTLNFLAGWYPSQDDGALVTAFGFSIYTRPVGNGVRWQANLPAPTGYRTNVTRVYFAVTNSASALTTTTLYTALNTVGSMLRDATTVGPFNIPLAASGTTNLVEVSFTNATGTAWTSSYQNVTLTTGNPSGTGYVLGGKQEWYP